MEFNKLVRDNIPEIIESNGEKPDFVVIEDDHHYLKALLEKDLEESSELAESLSLEELADKLEVLYAIAEALHFTREQVEQARMQKFSQRGGFAGRIYLKSVD